MRVGRLRRCGLADPAFYPVRWRIGGLAGLVSNRDATLPAAQLRRNRHSAASLGLLPADRLGRCCAEQEEIRRTGPCLRNVFLGAARPRCSSAGAGPARKRLPVQGPVFGISSSQRWSGPPGRGSRATAPGLDALLTRRRVGSNWVWCYASCPNPRCAERRRASLLHTRRRLSVQEMETVETPRLWGRPGKRERGAGTYRV